MNVQVLMSLLISGVDLTRWKGERRDLHVHRAQQAWSVRTEGDPARCWMWVLWSESFSFNHWVGWWYFQCFLLQTLLTSLVWNPVGKYRRPWGALLRSHAMPRYSVTSDKSHISCHLCASYVTYHTAEITCHALVFCPMSYVTHVICHNSYVTCHT